MKAIIYCRKSTDRSDRQQLSISSQESEARKIAQREWLKVVEVFRETKSAKEPWRPLFNEMMALLSSWKADCVITWKLNRLARNPVDEWTIKWSIQNWLIKAIYTEWETFKSWDNVLIMWMHFWMSTQYILDLQRDIKRWMKEKIEKWWVCQKAPIWYINNRLEKTVEIDPIKSKWVKNIFELRKQKYAYTTISKMLFEKWITKDNWKPFSKTTLEDIIKNKFYLWYVKFKWTYYKAKYKTFISQKLYDEANNIYQWMYEHKNSDVKYPLKWFIRDSSGIVLTAFSKKWNKYYWSQNYSKVKVNINEDKLFDKIFQKLENYRIPKDLLEFNKKVALKILDDNKNIEEKDIKILNQKIKKLEEKKTTLLDLRLEWEIDKQVYNKRFNEITFEIWNIENEKNKILNRKDEKKINKIIELYSSLYESQKLLNKEQSTVGIKKLIIELFIDTKKELSIAESPYLKFIKFLNFWNGGA